MANEQRRPIRATFGVWLFIAPCLAAFLAVPVVAAPASEACGSDLLEADWNKTVDRAALVPWNVYDYYDDWYMEEDMLQPTSIRGQDVISITRGPGGDVILKLGR